MDEEDDKDAKEDFYAASDIIPSRVSIIYAASYLSRLQNWRSSLRIFHVPHSLQDSKNVYASQVLHSQTPSLP